MINEKGQLILLNDYKNGEYKKSKLRDKIKDIEKRAIDLHLIPVELKEDKDPDGDYEYNTKWNTYETNIYGSNLNNWVLVSDSSNGTASSATSTRFYITKNDLTTDDLPKSSIYDKKDEKVEEKIRKKLVAAEKKRLEKSKTLDELKKFNVELFIEKLIKHTQLIGVNRFDAIKFIWNGNQELFWTGNSSVINGLDGQLEIENGQVADYRTYWDEVIYEFGKVQEEAKGIKKVINMIKKTLKGLNRKKEEAFASNDPIKVMELFKDALEDLDASDDQIKKMKDFIKQLAKGKSKPMVARACQKLMVTNFENRLLQDGKFTTYVSEEQAVKFIKSSKRGLALDLMVDFPRTIPDEVLEKFNQAEELEVFDQYIILHYIPEDERPARTLTKKEAKVQRDKDKKKEIARKRDPILFGLIRGSRKLYYIADWIDEKCDLTLEKMMKEISQEAYEL